MHDAVMANPPTTNPNSTTTRSGVRAAACVLALLAGGVLGGCFDSGLSATSTCSSFLSASQNDQVSAVDTIGRTVTKRNPGSLETGNAVLNVEYLCQSNKNMTLGDAVRHSFVGTGG